MEAYSLLVGRGSNQGVRIVSRPEPEFRRTITCEKCKTEAEHTQDSLERDGFKVSGYFFDGTDVSETHYFLTCPTCGQYSVVPDDEVPEVVKIHVRESGRDYATTRS